MPKARISSCTRATSAGWVRRIAMSWPGAVEQDLVLVTQNARDFRGLVSVRGVHPGLIILPGVGRVRSETLLRAAIEYLCRRGDPMDVMVNRVLEVTAEEEMTLYGLSS